MSSMGNTSYQEILTRLFQDPFVLQEEDIERLLDFYSSEILSKILKNKVEVFLQKGVFYIFKDNDEIIKEPLEVLDEKIIKRMITYSKNRLQEEIQYNDVLILYRLIKNKIGSLIKGELIQKQGDDWHVEFEVKNIMEFNSPEKEKIKIVGICPKMELGFSDRKNFKKGMQKYFLIKNCQIMYSNGTYRLQVILSRMSRTFIKKLFHLKGITNIKKIKRVPFNVKIIADGRISKEVIKWVAQEIDENVQVSY